MEAPPESRGGRDGFTERYVALAPALYIWLRLRTPPLLEGVFEPDDLLQEIWLRAYRIRDRFDLERSSFRAWLFVVAKNVLFEAARRAARLRRFSIGSGRTSQILRLKGIPDEATSVTRRVARDEELRRLGSWLEELPEPDRDLVVHLGLEGLSQGEAAARLGLSREALKKRWQRLRARLRAEGAAGILSGEEPNRGGPPPSL